MKQADLRFITLLVLIFAFVLLIASAFFTSLKALSVNLAESSYSFKPNETATIDFSLDALNENVTDLTCSFTLENDTETLLQDQISCPSNLSNETYTGSFSFEVPNELGDFNLTIYVNGTLNQQSIEVNDTALFTIEPLASISIEEVSLTKLCLGQDALIKFYVTNEGNIDLNITASLINSSNLQVQLINDEFELKKGSTKTIYARIKGLKVGEATLELSFTGSSAEYDLDTSQTKVRSLSIDYCTCSLDDPTIGLNLIEQISNKQFSAGEELVFTAIITNNGSARVIDIKTILFNVDEAEPYYGTEQIQSIEFNSYETKSVPIRIPLPYYLREGSYKLWIQVNEKSSQNCKVTSIPFFIVEKPKILVKSLLESSYTCGFQELFKFKIQNTASEAVKLRVIYKDDLGNEATKELRIDGFAAKIISFNLTIDEINKEGLHEATLLVEKFNWNKGVYELVTRRIVFFNLTDCIEPIINQTYSVQKQGKAVVNRGTKLKISVVNNGNVPTLYSLNLTGLEGVIKANPDSIELEPGEEGSFELIIQSEETGLKQLNFSLVYSNRFEQGQIPIEYSIVFMSKGQAFIATLLAPIYLVMAKIYEAFAINTLLSSIVIALIILIVILAIIFVKVIKRTKQVIEFKVTKTVE